MKTTRPHRFPPLAQVGRASAALDGQAGAQLQASLAQGFQEGLAKGYEEGYASGLRTGTDEARAAAEAAGHAQGLAAGREDAKVLLTSPVAAVDTLLSHLCQLQQDYQSAMRREVVELVERVARQVIRAELTLRPSQLMALVDETLSSMPPSHDGVEVFLNPEDRQRLLELGPERIREWTLRADAALDPGECRVIAGGREADAGCRQRLAATMAQVRGQLMPETTLDGQARPDPAELGDAVNMAGAAAATDGEITP
ncbi:flagellar assembly protein FliH [Roseateles sp.]|uniref:flagellar assembly protein FliH n=1 Tax=Roseateles sp. TaxID=1971397 RepID=UPI0031D5E3D3